jgi:hypothetical protein
LRQYGNGLIFGNFATPSLLVLLVLHMRVDFNQLPDHARVWIYAAAKPLTPEQAAQIQQQGDDFAEQWTAHQMPLKASFTIIDEHFLVFGVDVAHHDISGCGIDKSVRLVQEWEQTLGIPLFNRLQIELKSADKTQVTTKTQVAEWLQQQTITPQTLFYNKLVQNVGELKSAFLVPLEQMWFYPQLVKQTA